MKTITIFALVAAVALVAAALVGVGLAQLTTPNPTPVQQTPAPWCINGNPDGAAPYCYSATGIPPAYAGTQAQGAYGYGAQGCHGYGAQGAGQNLFGGMMGRGW